MSLSKILTAGWCPCEALTKFDLQWVLLTKVLCWFFLVMWIVYNKQHQSHTAQGPFLSLSLREVQPRPITIKTTNQVLVVFRYSQTHCVVL